MSPTWAITTDASDDYHVDDECPSFLAGQKGNRVQGIALHPVRPLSPRDVRKPCPTCVTA